MSHSNEMSISNSVHKKTQSNRQSLVGSLVPSVLIEDNDVTTPLVNIHGKHLHHGHLKQHLSFTTSVKRGLSQNESFSYLNKQKKNIARTKSAHWNNDQDTPVQRSISSSMNITAFNRKSSKVSADMHAVNRILYTLQQAKKIVLKYSSFLNSEADGSSSPAVDTQQGKRGKAASICSIASSNTTMTLDQVPGDEISEALIKNIDINITQLKSLKMRMIKDETVMKFDDSLKVSEEFGQYLAYFCQKKEQLSKTISAKAVAPASSGSDFVLFLKKLEQIGGKKGLEVTDTNSLLMMFENVNKFDFNLFELANCTNMPLTLTMYMLFSCFNLFHELHICEETFVNFMLKVEEKSNIAIAHNALYSATMAQTAYILLLTPAVAATNLEILAVFLACAIRCVDHKGGSNQFLIATDPDLAEQYLNLHPAENHSLHVGLGLLQEKDCDFLSALAWEDRTSTRRIVSYLLPCMDPERHMDLMMDLNTLVLKKTNRDVEDRKVLLQILYRNADLAKLARPLQVCKQWVDMYKKEHFHQGDMEAKLGLRVSPMCNRKSSDFFRWVMTIMDFVVNPLFEMWAEVTDVTDMWRRAMDNREYFLMVLKMPRNMRPASFSGQLKNISFSQPTSGPESIDHSRKGSFNHSRKGSMTHSPRENSFNKSRGMTPRTSKGSNSSSIRIIPDVETDIQECCERRMMDTGGLYLTPDLAPPPLSDPRLPGYLTCQALHIQTTTGKQHPKKR